MSSCYRWHIQIFIKHLENKRPKWALYRSPEHYAAVDLLDFCVTNQKHLLREHAIATACARNRLLRAHAIGYCVRTQYLLREHAIATACSRNRLLRAHAIPTACARNTYCVRTQYLLREHAIPTALARNSYCVRTQ